jgi:hypothetical protein
MKVRVRSSLINIEKIRFFVVDCGRHEYNEYLKETALEDHKSNTGKEPTKIVFLISCEGNQRETFPTLGHLFNISNQE